MGEGQATPAGDKPALERGSVLTPGIGDHVKNRKVQGSTYRVVGRDAKFIRVRCIETGVPALVRRSELEFWKVVWSPEVGLEDPGLEDLRRDRKRLVRVDADRACQVTR